MSWRTKTLFNESSGRKPLLFLSILKVEIQGPRPLDSFYATSVVVMMLMLVAVGMVHLVELLEVLHVVVMVVLVDVVEVVVDTGLLVDK